MKLETLLHLIDNKEYIRIEKQLWAFGDYYAVPVFEGPKEDVMITMNEDEEKVRALKGKVINIRPGFAPFKRQDEIVIIIR